MSISKFFFYIIVGSYSLMFVPLCTGYFMAIVFKIDLNIVSTGLLLPHELIYKIMS